MAAGYFRNVDVSFALLTKILHLPPGFQVDAVGLAKAGAVMIRIQCPKHAQFAVEEFHTIPQIDGTVKVDYALCGHVKLYHWKELEELLLKEKSQPGSSPSTPYLYPY